MRKLIKLSNEANDFYIAGVFAYLENKGFEPVHTFTYEKLEPGTYWFNEFKQGYDDAAEAVIKKRGNTSYRMHP